MTADNPEAGTVLGFQVGKSLWPSIHRKQRMEAEESGNLGINGAWKQTQGETLDPR